MVLWSMALHMRGKSILPEASYFASTGPSAWMYLPFIGAQYIVDLSSYGASKYCPYTMGVEPYCSRDR